MPACDQGEEKGILSKVVVNGNVYARIPALNVHVGIPALNEGALVVKKWHRSLAGLQVARSLS